MIAIALALEGEKKKQRTDTKNEAYKIKNDALQGANREKTNISKLVKLTILQKYDFILWVYQ